MQLCAERLRCGQMQCDACAAVLDADGLNRSAKTAINELAHRAEADRLVGRAWPIDTGQLSEDCDTLRANWRRIASA
jgi:NAD(P)H-hydrate repair Nnr-like enzyme with NAD(P)H-hydrate dehydratase domain